MTPMIFNRDGQRKYLTPAEIDVFVNTAHGFPSGIRLFCMMIAYSGCRISEALAMKKSNIDFASRHVVIRCLKKRGKTIFRSIPLPSRFLDMLKSWIRREKIKDCFLWPWSRMTGYRRIRDVMNAANIRGRHASPKGLRHGFGVRAVQSSVPLTLIQRWLGHADIKTTAIYTNAIGPEERRIASRMWRANVINKASSNEHAAIAPDNTPLDVESNSNIHQSRDSTDSAELVNQSLTTKAHLECGRHISSIIQPVSPNRLIGKTNGCTLIHSWLNRNSIFTYFSASYVNDAVFDPLQHHSVAMGLNTMSKPNPDGCSDPKSIHPEIVTASDHLRGRTAGDGLAADTYSGPGCKSRFRLEADKRQAGVSPHGCPMADQHGGGHSMSQHFDIRTWCHAVSHSGSRTLPPLLAAKD
ncbi:tyrosine-type recombinase/integrase [Sphingomonas fuzhouensis]|uniref:tyrosine-type recombinase/integrase n=1 Tax=Sphingomonas fuzhouensis TaxID=3106033 RepID=UPI002AFE1D2B|nr:tyrosine-type recombinase/integrase [Sphingomonas sp. SGZ-02]